MKIRKNRFRFEGWKTILLFVLNAKLILDGALFYTSVRNTLRIVDSGWGWYRKDIEYIETYGWFMYLCFGLMLLFDIIMVLRVVFSSQYKLLSIRQNAGLDLFRKNSRTKAEKFCLITMIWLVIPFIFMMGYVNRIVEDFVALSVITYIVIYIVAIATIRKSLKKVSRIREFSRNRLAVIQAARTQYGNYSANLFNENAVFFENLTDYMISSFSTGNFSPTGTIFYDLNNELMPWLSHVPEFSFDIASRRNHIVVADCAKIEDLDSFINRIYKKFRQDSSKYACLTVGLVNAQEGLSEKDFKLGLAKDIKIVTFASYKVLELMSLSLGRIPIIREIGTAGENCEAVRIAEETRLSQNSGYMAEKFNVLFNELRDISLKYYNGVTQPDYGYATTSIVLENIGTKRMGSIYLSRLGCYYLADPERRLSNELRKIGINPEINPDNEYLYSILKNILFEPSEVKRIMGLFDYIDFMLRTVEIYLYIKQGGEAEGFEIETSFYKLASKILEYSPETNRAIRKTISIPLDNHINGIMGSVKVYFNLVSATGNIDFCGLCHFIDIVRNKTRGHGSIKEENSCIINSFLLMAIELLHDFLAIRNFNIIVDKDKAILGYGEEKCDCGKIIYVKEGLPCIPIRTQGDKKEYINFFKGKYIVPEFVEAE